MELIHFHEIIGLKSKMFHLILRMNYYLIFKNRSNKLTNFYSFIALKDL